MYMVVSWYHFQRMNTLYAFTGSFDAFFDHFLDGNMAYGDYWHNVLSWWARRALLSQLAVTEIPQHIWSVVIFEIKKLAAYP